MKKYSAEEQHLLIFVSMIVGVIIVSLFSGIFVYVWQKKESKKISQGLNDRISLLEIELAKSTGATPAAVETVASASSSTSTLTDINDLQFSARKELYQVARNYVVKNSVADMEFDLLFKKQVGNWVVFAVVPENVETDTAQLFLEQVDGQWQVRGFGTEFEELYNSHPELF